MNKTVFRKALISVESYGGVKRFLATVTREGDLYWSHATISSSSQRDTKSEAHASEQNALDAAEKAAQSWLSYNKGAVEV